MISKGDLYYEENRDHIALYKIFNTYASGGFQYFKWRLKYSDYPKPLPVEYVDLLEKIMEHVEPTSQGMMVGETGKGWVKIER